MASMNSDFEASDLLAALSVDDKQQHVASNNLHESSEDDESDKSAGDQIPVYRATPNRRRAAADHHLDEDDSYDEDDDDDTDNDDDSDSEFGDSDDEKMDNHHHNSNYSLGPDYSMGMYGGNNMKPLLPPQKDCHKGKLCVVLDMDETLIHSVFESADNNFRQAEDRASTRHKHHFTVVVGTDDEVETAHVYKRPGLMRFMDELAKHCEVIVFTAALPVYAKPVLDMIDPKSHIIHRLYRDATVTYQGQPFVKDLGRLGRDMRKCVLVDNNPFALLATPDNAMPIQSFYDDPEDNELEKALQLLLEMSKLDDVRPYLQERFNFRQHLQEMLRMSGM